MYFHYSNFNRYKITKIAFSVFLIVGILNWTFVPGTISFAEADSAGSYVEPKGDAPPAEAVVETPPASETPPPSETVVDTGDAISQTETQNDVNTTEVSTESGVAQGAEVSSAETDLNVQNESGAEVQNTSDTAAETGTNGADGGSGDATINTGDAVANADVVNTINTNIIESEGDIIVGGDSLGNSSLDLRDDFGGGGGGCDSCLGDISITNQNTATATNNVIVTAETGGNNASGAGSATITTGDAYAAANVVNIVNTNIIKSNYILLVFNNFGDWSGDLIFPNGDFFKNFFSGFASGCPACGGDVDISNNNSGSVSSSVSTSADSGGNTAEGGGASVNTGDSAASSNVFNQINTNIYGRSSFYLKIKVFGDWSGSIFNLPENIAWGRSGDDIILYDRNDGSPFENEGLVSNNGNDLSVQNTNSADVSNNIQVSASTGNNSASGGDASIITGNAYAVTNEVNIVNTNIISSNWTAALVNIFGNWQGNLSFGQPDLWIGTIAESASVLTPGGMVKFITTIKNNGDATASGIKVLTKPQSSHLNIIGDTEWFLSPLAAGESTEVSYYGAISGGLPEGQTSVVNQTSVSLRETDGNLDDNTDVITLSVYTRGTVMLPYTSRSFSYPDLEIIKTHAIPSSINVGGVEMVPFGGSADYKITVKNHGGSAFEGVLFDQLKNEAGEIINKQSWDLGEILPDEEITLTYTTEFTEETAAGTYTNYAWVEALGGDYSYDPAIASTADSNIASDKVVVAEKPVAEVEEKKEKPVGEVLGIFNEDASIMSQEEQYMEFLGGFCMEEKNNKIPLSVSQSILLGLSFILIMKRRKDIPHNMFLI
ncbi:MAG: hypothetical protein V1896_02320 [Candidatus Zambryskibacteria bacterium]